MSASTLPIPAVTHVAGPLQIKRSEHHPINLYRLSCSCGRYAGCWYGAPKTAREMYENHVKGLFQVTFR